MITEDRWAESFRQSQEWIPPYWYEKDGVVIMRGSDVDKGQMRSYQSAMARQGWRLLNPNKSDHDMKLYQEFISKQSNTNTMKQSKVKQVTANGTWDSKFGTMYKFEYLFEDGQIVNANHKTADGAFAIGTLLEYEITNAEYNNGKVSKPQDVQPGVNKSFVDNTKGIKIGHAITNAVNLQIAYGGGDEKDMRVSIKNYAKMIYQISEDLNNEL